MYSLDLFSTSQTKQSTKRSKKVEKDKRIYDECKNNAPLFAYQISGKKWGVVQGCCNDWNCPRCGQQRAREEYGRIVAGAREISKTYPLYFFTITCRGKEMSLDEAENNYLKWTNRLLSRLRVSTKRAGGKWFYASVTERQERLHPHSHYITTYCPPDGILVKKGQTKRFYQGQPPITATHDTLQSEVVELACTECGLGYQYDLSRVESVEAGSRYMAKYLFKAGIFETVWPKGWKRVRYSNNWPKLPKVSTDAFILIDWMAWSRLAREALIIKTQDAGVSKIVHGNLDRADVIIQ